MKPQLDDVKQLVAALFTVIGGIEKARRSIPDASKLAVLQIVARRAPVRPSEIAAELNVHQSSVTRQMRGLEESGWVHLEADPNDRRSCFVTLTREGEDEIRRLSEVGLNRFVSFLEGWDAEEVRTLSRLLFKFEMSKAEASKKNPPPSGRHWQKKKGE
ncbi:MarR family winged helix-turn-helix transcriptional regulator [Paenibacillus humicola]|uniref:MarR family winged helix-turn-helix transcriptional regulator n=1 Tax=Paenibacillus humicola TaxID=3110540 RepID=UPI00237AB00C|nr:MarR family transcriptional regulator [Paenibacillus humicola]